MVEPPFPEKLRRPFGRTGAGERQHAAVFQDLRIGMTAEVLARPVEGEEQIALLEQPLDLGNGFRKTLAAPLATLLPINRQSNAAPIVVTAIGPVKEKPPSRGTAAVERRDDRRRREGVGPHPTKANMPSSPSRCL